MRSSAEAGSWKKHNKDPVRALAPQRPPIVLQRWSVKRVALAAAVLAIAAVSGFYDVRAFSPADDLGAYAPRCGTGHSIILSAQAVPSAAKLPCIAALPSGWSIGGAHLQREGYLLAEL